VSASELSMNYEYFKNGGTELLAKKSQKTQKFCMKSKTFAKISEMSIQKGELASKYFS
jgi:hypothetical protein